MSSAAEHPVDLVDAYRCLECGHVSDEEGPPLYECCQIFNRDGSADGESNRCPSCNKFGSKLADASCVQCEEGEVEPVQAVEVDGDLVAVDAGDDPGAMISEAVARRAEEKAAEAAREQGELDQQNAMRGRYEAAERKRAADLEVGDCFFAEDLNVNTPTGKRISIYAVTGVREKPWGLEGRIGVDTRCYSPRGEWWYSSLSWSAGPDEVFAIAVLTEVEAASLRESRS